MFTLSFETDNAAFGDNAEERAITVAAMLKLIAMDIERYGALDVMGRAIRDQNGNKIGFWQWSVA